MPNRQGAWLGLCLSHVILSLVSPPTRGAPNRVSQEGKKPCRIAQNCSRRKKYALFATHTGLPRLLPSLRFLPLQTFHSQGHASITMESSSKAPVKLVKVTRVLGRTGTMRIPLALSLSP